MTDTDTIEFKNIDPDDISDVLSKVEKSFNFKFSASELKDVITFGQLCDIITSKVQGANRNDCTTQQAFYKLRNAIVKATLLDKTEITAQTDLQKLFPRSSRRRQIRIIEPELGFKIKILRPRHSLTVTLLLTLITSFICLFFYWSAGLAGLIISILGTLLANNFGNELDLQNVGQVANKITREHYLKVRSKAGTINKNEIAEFVKELFRNDLDLDQAALTREAVFM